MELIRSDLNSALVKAYYRFENGALTTDSSGNSHTLTAVSDPAEDTSGRYGSAIALDGNDAYTAVDHADFKPTGNFTVCGWMKSATSAGTPYIFQSYSQNTNRAGIFVRTEEATGAITVRSGRNTGAVAGTDYQAVVAGTNVSNNVWHHFAYTWDGAYLRVYVDGIIDAAPVAWTYAPAYAATNYVRIGCVNLTGTDTAFFTGSVDDLALYNGKALAADEVWSLYDDGRASFLLNFV